MKNTPSKDVICFQNDWFKHYGKLQPMGWVMRQEASLAWVRFHSLPASKRYAETDMELATILKRANQLADDMLAKKSECWVICSRCDDIAGPGALAGHWAEDLRDPDSIVWKYFIRAAEWANGLYDRELKEIVDDSPYYMTWFDPISGVAFAPYDGGFDLFLRSPEEVTKFKSLYSDWLSDRDDGL